MTTSVDPVLSDVESLFKKLIWDNWVSSAMNLLFTELPFLNVWPLGPIVKAVLVPFLDRMFAMAVLFLDLETIALKNAEHQAQYNSAMTQLRIIAQDKGVESDDFLKARDQAAAAMAAFTQFNK